MLRFDRMTVEQLNSALYLSEIMGNWQEADDIAMYLASIEATDGVTAEIRSEIELWNVPTQGIHSHGEAA